MRKCERTGSSQVLYQRGGMKRIGRRKTDGVLTMPEFVCAKRLWNMIGNATEHKKSPSKTNSNIL